MITLVTGIQRSGTTAMMRALGGYLPISGEGPFLELPREEIRRGIGWRYRGTVVKLFADCMGALREENYRAVYLVRDSEDIVRSFWRAFPEGWDYHFPSDPAEIERRQRKCLRWWQDSSVDTVYVGFEAFRDDPGRILEQLIERWNLDGGHEQEGEAVEQRADQGGGDRAGGQSLHRAGVHVDAESDGALQARGVGEEG